MASRPPLVIAAACSQVSFSVPVNYPVGTSGGLGTSDLNGDGKSDLVVLAGTITILINKGDGTFQTQATYTTTTTPAAVGIGDFNGDKKADLVIANVLTNNFSVFLGNGDGTFQAPVTFGNLRNPSYLAVADFNGDGKLDFVAAFHGGISVYLGKGDGTFQTGLNNGTPYIPDEVAVADFNGDGKLDLVTVDYLDKIYVLLGKGDGTFQSNFSSNGIGSSIAVADFNNDGKLDFIYLGPFGGLSGYTGKGDGTFNSLASTGAKGDSTARKVVAGDFNGDGNSDLAVTSDNGVTINLGKGDGTFQPAGTYVANSSSYIVLADFNQDKRLDIATSSSNGTNILLNQPLPAVTLGVTASSASGLTGQAVNLTITARDVCGSVATGYGGTVKFTSTDPNALLPANYTFTAADSGVKTFGVTFKTAGSQTVTITDTASATLTASSAIGVSAAAPFTILPATIRVGSTLNSGTSPLVATGATPKPGDTSSTLISITNTNGIPADATGVVGILTNVGCEAGGNLRLWAGSTVPNAVNLNVAGSSLGIPGATAALNLSTGFIAPLDTSGKLYLGWGSAAGTKCGYALDITGYLTATSPIKLLPAAVRLAATVWGNPKPELIASGDTPDPTGSSSIQITAGGANNIPADATGIIGILTNVNCKAGGNLRFWAGNTVPTSVNLNIPGSSLAIPGAATALNLSTNFTAPLDASGKVYLGWASTPGKSCGYAVDVTGYLAAGSSASISVLPNTARVAISVNSNTFVPLVASGNTPKTGEASSVQITIGGANNIPTGAKGVIGIVTNIGCNGGGNLRFWTGSSVPTSVNLNVPGSSLAIPGATTALNLSTGFIASLDSGGKVYLGWASAGGKSCGYAVDIVAYF